MVSNKLVNGTSVQGVCLADTWDYFPKDNFFCFWYYLFIQLSMMISNPKHWKIMWLLKLLCFARIFLWQFSLLHIRQMWELTWVLDLEENTTSSAAFDKVVSRVHIFSRYISLVRKPGDRISVNFLLIFCLRQNFNW